MDEVPVIWKFVVNPWLPVEMPLDADLLSVGTQGDELVMWAAINPNRPTRSRRIHVVPTGGHMPTLARTYVGTAQFDNGLVMHVFDGGYE
jgi:hypothetical protein